MKLIDWNFHYWLLLSLFFLFFMSTSLAYEVDANENSSISSIKPPNSEHNNEQLIEELLKKFVRNGSRQLFEGSFIYMFEDSLQTIKIKRVVNAQGEVVEEFIPEDDKQKHSSRRLVNHYCTLDNGWQYQFQALSSSFPFRVNNHYQDLKKNYEFILTEPRMIAGHPALGLSIKAKDPYRYGYRLWFEPDTATLLRYKLMAPNGKVVEQYLFTDITFYNNENSSVVIDASQKIKTCLAEFQNLSSVFEQYFSLNKIPKGYEPVSFRQGIINEGSRQAYQFQLSDGFASVSIFIEEVGQAKRPVNGVVKMGPVYVAGKTLDNQQVTVLGAIPVISTLHFLKAVKEPVK
ncbi:MAG: MucB/RseB C-terminal domain-containing protein [gamma proteobacterium symbiont of Lucinoma myriamae]|nr:MucB/RseB C-terminal domain-containing protein [gamma proteobacterium symbiont of Lucinoma myriamae]